MFFTYPPFVTMMVCEKKSFCPVEILNIFDNEKVVQQKKFIEDTSCRILPIQTLKIIKAVAIVLTGLCLITKAIIDCMKRAKAPSDPENIELEELGSHPQSDPLPPFQNTRRLRQFTLVFLVLTTIVIRVVYASLFWNGNLYLAYCLSFVHTLIIPCSTLLLEKRILRFSCSIFIDLFSIFM